jgi:ubiquitin carboxyl-terminal hydrolase 5/13
MRTRCRHRRRKVDKKQEVLPHRKHSSCSFFSEENAAAAAAPNVPAAVRECRNGPSKYQLRAFISHMGSSTHSGHYVAHVLRDDGKWYIFNDEKVAISQNPPKSLGYLYLYRRINGSA